MKYLMKDPALYKIGLNKECVSNKLFGMWVVYGLVQSYCIYYIAFIIGGTLGFSESQGRD